jgi:DNA-binding XRE family transcriptional regulator
MQQTPTPRTPQEAPPAFTSPAAAVLTGADLAAWRAARGLTQRPAADLLGVAPSTVAKAELLPGKVLGEQLQIALAAALRR